MDLLPTHANSPHETIFWASGEQLAVRRGAWKLVDIGETRNRRHDDPARAEDLERLVRAWLSAVNS